MLLKNIYTVIFNSGLDDIIAALYFMRDMYLRKQWKYKVYICAATILMKPGVAQRVCNFLKTLPYIQDAVKFITADKLPFVLPDNNDYISIYKDFTKNRIINCTQWKYVTVQSTFHKDKRHWLYLQYHQQFVHYDTWLDVYPLQNKEQYNVLVFNKSNKPAKVKCCNMNTPCVYINSSVANDYFILTQIIGNCKLYIGVDIGLNWIAAATGRLMITSKLTRTINTKTFYNTDQLMYTLQDDYNIQTSLLTDKETLARRGPIYENSSI